MFTFLLAGKSSTIFHHFSLNTNVLQFFTHSELSTKLIHYFSFNTNVLQLFTHFELSTTIIHYFSLTTNVLQFFTHSERRLPYADFHKRCIFVISPSAGGITHHAHPLSCPRKVSAHFRYFEQTFSRALFPCSGALMD